MSTNEAQRADNATNMLMARSKDQDSIEALICDMDGVVTHTMQAHFDCWKAVFDEFLHDRARISGTDFFAFTLQEYFDHVDGEPRYDGIRNFLKSRGIKLPEGPDDDTSMQTVHGLGNRKNERFHVWLDHHKVATYDDALDLIRSAKKLGLKVGVFSSSQNAERVLKSAGISELFDERVDGNDARRLHLPGKPDPAILLELAKRLSTKPSRCVVIEDAVSGVKAGTAGNFLLVIGVNREQRRKALHGLDLRANGADLVTRDLRRLVKNDDLTFKVMDRLPSIWDCLQEIQERIKKRSVSIFLDYDGTLTPIVEDYNKALLSEDTRETLKRLAQQTRVAIISGRDLADVRRLVGIGELFYAGSHGFDIAGPNALHERPGNGIRFLPALDSAERKLRNAVKSIEGTAIERKTFSIAVHYRKVAEHDIESVANAVDDVVKMHEELRKSRGKKVFQVQPHTDWDKGHAVRWLLDNTDLGTGHPLPFYIGDDFTDEDAFEALSDDGVTIVVCDGSRRATVADYRLENPQDVQHFLDWLADHDASD